MTTYWKCPTCGRTYESPIDSATIECSGSGRRKHKQTKMKKRDPYQGMLDSLGIPDDDPLRRA